MKTILLYGGWEAELEEGGLRYIRYQGTEVARGICAFVRDRDWKTVPSAITQPVMTTMPDGLKVFFRCRCLQGDIIFVWDGTISLTDRGLKFDFDGRALTDFLRNRIGFSVLLPMEFAGLDVIVERDRGGTERECGRLPVALSPFQPFKAIQAMIYEPRPGLRVRMAFHGELFEMEDQRNWTDASYKIYCTPLELPFPVRVAAGETVQQAIEVKVQGELPASDGPAGEWSERRTGAAVELLEEAGGRLPGIGATLAGAEPDEAEAGYLASLRPAYLRIVADLAEKEWRETLKRAASWADRLSCKLELELVTDEANGAELEAFASWAAAERLPIARIVPYSAASFVTDTATLAAVKTSLRKRRLPIAVGGGTRANYAEFNRASLPLDQLEFAAYSINPQVHAFDDRSLMETLPVHRVTAADALAKNGKPLYVGPVELKPRLNPVATSGSGAVEVRERIDKRLSSPFGAAWALGSAAALCLDGVEGITYFETHGPVGLVEGEIVRPVYSLLKILMDHAGATVRRTICDHPAIAAIALNGGDGLLLLLANTSSLPLEVAVCAAAHAGEAARISAIDESSASETRLDDEGRFSVALGSYDCACVALGCTNAI